MSDRESDFVRALLAQDPLVGAARFDEQRARILARLGRAERRERAARRVTLAFAAAGCLGLGVLVGANTGALVLPGEGTDILGAAGLVGVLVMFVTLCAVLPLYVFRHRREARLARQEADRLALAGLQAQIEDLKRRLPPEPAAKDTPKAPGAAGFTLVELLVTIGVLGILASLTFPALSRSKAVARRTVCQSHLGQVGKALAMYLGEHHAYPTTMANPFIPGEGTASSVPVGGLGDSDGLETWDQWLLPYLASATTVFECPARVPTAAEVRLRGYRANYHYGYNALGGGVNGSSRNLGLGRVWLSPGQGSVPSRVSSLRTSETDVANAAGMIAVMDRQGGVELPTAIVQPGDPTRRADNDPANLHLGSGNAVYCDGHVQAKPQARWKEKSDPARREWNNDGQPHPETW